ncbi:zinc finger BED domain-containing protein RICESLEEPER 1-like [Gossypium australe]|uniref:Zinc finger BED domain-containing protein RICESLEEPER 1-like n=1 Tax=Gossypium australe TaxID=47621 RepID=A0A5B6VIX5_9ROSI|nr:zinc finger BED domain-containing protein RICESLEEPER 1-like [Gossypium australe]
MVGFVMSKPLTLLRLFAITVDNCTTNDAMMDILHGEFPYGSLFLRADGAQSFGMLLIKGSKSLNNKKMALDCKTRCSKYREVFVILSGRENLYKNPPNNKDWEKVEKICEKLEVFSTTTLDFSTSTSPTVNIYFPKIFTLKLAISNWLSFPCDYIRKMAQVMLEKYKYWIGVNDLMGVATILDPRYKMALIRFYFKKTLDHDEAEREVSRISTFLCQLVDDIGLRMIGFKLLVLEHLVILVTLEDMHICKNLHNLWSKISVRTNRSTYPILQQIARHILSIPVATIPPESAFSTSGVLDPYRSRLLPESIEALMCAQNWIWANFKGNL